VNLSAQEQLQAIQAIEGEVTRLETLIREYGASRKPQNAVVKQMADEGLACRKEKVTSLRSLLAKMKGSVQGSAQ
jgi:hypothetical protein